MKIICLNDNYDSNKKTIDTLSNKVIPIIHEKADTALLTSNRPFFIPDFATKCTCGIEVVFRICRLGRSISQRFAHRYYDAISVGVSFRADNLLKEQSERGLPWEIAVGFDGSAALGTFEPFQSFDPEAADFYMTINDEEMQRGNIGNFVCGIDRAIEYVSQFYTLRQGDYFYMGMPSAPVAISNDCHIKAFLSGKELLSFNVK